MGDDVLRGVKSPLGCEVCVALVSPPCNLHSACCDEAAWFCLLAFLNWKMLLPTPRDPKLWFSP